MQLGAHYLTAMPARNPFRHLFENTHGFLIEGAINRTNHLHIGH